jgi:hypothetical protein
MFDNGYTYCGGGALSRPVYDDVAFTLSGMPYMIYGSLNGLQNTTLRTKANSQNPNTQNYTQHDVSLAMDMIETQMTNIETSPQNNV